MGTTAGCGGGDKVDAKNLTPFVPGDLLKAAKASVDMVVPGLSAEEVSGVGAAVCRSIEKEDSIDKTRAVVREAVKNIGRDGLTASVKDDRFADRVITAFKGPYCTRINKAQ
jgi:hypothetical protein